MENTNKCITFVKQLNDMKNINKDTDFMKAIKKADREMELENSVGFKCITRVHKSKKEYSRKNKSNFLENSY